MTASLAPSGATLTLDLQGRILTASPQTLALFGYPREDFLGQPIQSLLRPAPVDVADCQGRFTGISQCGKGIPLQMSLNKLRVNGHHILLAYLDPASPQWLQRS